jgi:TonB family protein
MRLPRRAQSEYQLKIEGHEPKIVWYKLPKELPQVTPPRREDDARPLRAEVKTKQAMVSSPENAPKKTQMVWTPAPEIAPKEIESPNIVAVRLPPRPFVEPSPPAPRPPAAKPLLAEAAPPIQMTVRPVELPMARLPPKLFVPPVITTLRVPDKVVATAADAPQLQAAIRAAELEISKLPPKPFVAPKTVTIPAPDKKVATAADAPEVGTGLVAGALDLSAPKLPARPFTAPPVVRTAGRGVDTSAALDLPANSPDLNVAVVGLNPLDKISALPAAPSPGAFSGGPVVRKEGATSEGDGKGISVPDLFVRGARDGKPDLIAQTYAAPTSKENLRAAIRREDLSGAVHAPPADVPALASGATRVSSAPDPRFIGREIFMMAIQMPQLTSYSGSWLMWYSDHTLHQTAMAPIAPPEAHRKVDPKYVASAVSERVEGRVTLACVIDRNGRVASVELLRGLDDRLNRSAMDALAKWEFYPATRSGVPVDVDVVVEIPFKLEPRVQRR